MKNTCLECGRGHMKEAKSLQVLSLPGAPDFTVSDAPVLVCDQCGYELMEFGESARLEQRFLGLVLDYYDGRARAMPGKVAQWLWKHLDITARQLAVAAQIQESTLSHAARRNSPVDIMAALILLLRGQDRVRGTMDARRWEDCLNSPSRFWTQGQEILVVARYVKAVAGSAHKKAAAVGIGTSLVKKAKFRHSIDVHLKRSY